MAVPTYDQFIDPLLRVLASRPEGIPARDAQDAAANVLDISDADRQVLIPSGSQVTYRNRANWAHDRLKRAGLSSSPRRGFWQLTQQGREFIHAHPEPLPSDEVEKLAVAFNAVRLRASDPAEELDAVIDPLSQVESARTASPDDRLAEAVAELRGSVAAELLESLGRASPTFFETVVLDVLHRMGYGASRSDLQRVGGTGDGGIDGGSRWIALASRKCMFQAKRWQATVGRPEIQGFYGALAGQRANKGVFITTSSYTSQALEFARSVERIVLVDGPRLAALMIDYEVGVSARTVKVPKIDSDYFDEEGT